MKGTGGKLRGAWLARVRRFAFFGSLLAVGLYGRAASAAEPTKPTEEAAPPEPTYDAERLRVRFGFDAAGGAMIGRAAAHTVAIRVGAQLGSTFGLHYQALGGLFFGTGDAGGLMSHAAMGALVLGDTVELGFGPSFTLRGAQRDAESGIFPSLNARLAFMFGADARRPGRRSGLSFVFHVQPTFVKARTFAGGTETEVGITRTLFLLGLGGEWY